MDINEALKEVGSWGRYQIVLCILVTVAGIPNGLFTMLFVFSHYEPNYHCKFPDDFSNLTVKIGNDSETFADFAIPYETDNLGITTRSRCKMFNRNYSAYEVRDWPKYFNDSDEVIKCTNGWDYQEKPYQKSAVTEFSMVCDDEWKPLLVISIYVAGLFFGSICGSLADRVGRRPIFLWSSLVQVLSVLLSSFSWDFTSYAVNTFFCGCSSLVNFMAAFVLATEMSDVRWRNFFALGTMFSFAVGYCMVSFLAFVFQNWRRLFQVTAAISAAMYLPNIWLFPESARWLIRKGKTEEGMEVLKRISRVNGNEQRFTAAIERKGSSIASEGEPKAGVKEIIRIFFRSGMTSRYMACTACWFTAGLVYYGVAYFSTSFSDDRFLNVFFAGLAEIPALLVGYYMAKFIGRPRTLCFLMMICAVSNITLPLLSKDASASKTAISMSGKGAISASYFIVYLIGSEIAPTLQRGACMGIFSTTSRVASLVSPFFMYTRKIHPFIPNGIMGAIGITCAGLAIFCIPETTGIPLPDSIEEAKSNQRIYGFNVFRRFPVRTKGKNNISDDKSRLEHLLSEKCDEPLNSTTSI